MSSKPIRSQSSGFRWRVERVLFSWPAGVLAACLTVLIIFGCMTHNHYNTIEGISATDGTLTQAGEVSLPGSAEQVVYYPIPYASPPNLELGKDQDWCKLLEQKAECFRIRNTWGGTSVVTWKARGLRMPPPPSGPPVPVAESATLQPPPVAGVSGNGPPLPPVPVVAAPK